ncbi:helix-turn-helix domain-containing protein [uncultured Imperialibacter sp.]|uniref:helix-turn-helix domain-containing protein n=1 Tax=Imperialibacter sp. TaxID=2038411 RepID=UPI0030D821C1|tara:strand:+ start:8542 stop:8814 length:273 start_codon:yes stop_codon:yes gene_type:complete
MPLICIQDLFLVKLTEQVIDQTCPTYKGKPKDLWVSPEEAMRLLRISSVTTLLKYKDTGKIRAARLSLKHILYDSNSILQFLDDQALNRF